MSHSRSFGLDEWSIILSFLHSARDFFLTGRCCRAAARATHQSTAWLTTELNGYGTTGIRRSILDYYTGVDIWSADMVRWPLDHQRWGHLDLKKSHHIQTLLHPPPSLQRHLSAISIACTDHDYQSIFAALPSFVSLRMVEFRGETMHPNLISTCPSPHSRSGRPVKTFFSDLTHAVPNLDAFIAHSLPDTLAFADWDQVGTISTSSIFSALSNLRILIIPWIRAEPLRKFHRLELLHIGHGYFYMEEQALLSSVAYLATEHCLRIFVGPWAESMCGRQGAVDAEIVVRNELYRRAALAFMFNRFPNLSPTSLSWYPADILRCYRRLCVDQWPEESDFVVRYPEVVATEHLMISLQQDTVTDDSSLCSLTTQTLTYLLSHCSRLRTLHLLRLQLMTSAESTPTIAFAPLFEHYYHLEHLTTTFAPRLNHAIPLDSLWSIEIVRVLARLPRFRSWRLYFHVFKGGQVLDMFQFEDAMLHAISLSASWCIVEVCTDSEVWFTGSHRKHQMASVRSLYLSPKMRSVLERFRVYWNPRSMRTYRLVLKQDSRSNNLVCPTPVSPECYISLLHFVWVDDDGRERYPRQLPPTTRQHWCVVL